MITHEQIDGLKGGEKLIFHRNGGVLSSQKGNVFTFSNWFTNKYSTGKDWWQCQELHNMGNRTHNFSIKDVELFDEKVHKEFVLMDTDELTKQEKIFIQKYGA